MEPLKFEASITGNAISQLDEIKAKIQQMPNISVSFSIEHKEGLEQLNALITGMRDAIKGGRFGTFAKNAEKCSEAIDKMVKSLEHLNKTAGGNEALMNYFVGLGETLKGVKNTMSQMEGAKLGLTPSQTNQYVKNVEKMEDALYRIQEARAKVSNAIKEGEFAGMNVSGMRIYMQTLDAYQNKLLAIKSDIDMMQSSGWQTKTFGTTFKHLLGNAGDFQRMVDEYNASSKKTERDNERMSDSMRKAGIAVSDLALKFDKLELSKVRANAVHAGVDTSAYDKAVERMERYKRILEYINQVGGHDATRITSSVGYRNAVNDLSLQTATLKQMTNEANAASNAMKKLSNDTGSAITPTSQMVEKENQLAQALRQTTSEANSQSRILGDLKSLATQYLGVWGTQQFLNNIIEIGGQLEQQRLSIGAILQNQSQANSLFAQIKGLAVQSPFGVVELDQMTKQLTAYGFKYGELFDMTKRLADISAATGTGVDRLALALGHVRSEAALSGYTLRQFAMGNVPLLSKLAEKMGKTTEEIRKMVRGKEITYEDVLGVLKDLTNEGGMFYNMQEVISTSVKARFKNVKDAMDIMYGEMAEGAPGDALKVVAENLMEVTRNWKDAATVIASGAAVWGIARTSVMLYNNMLGQNNAKALATITAYRRQEEVANSLNWTYRRLTTTEAQHTIVSRAELQIAKLKNVLGLTLTKTQQQLIIKEREQIVADMALAVSEKKLTTEGVARAVALGKITAAEGREILVRATLTEEERAAGIVAVNNVRTYGVMTKAINGLAYGFGKLGLAMKSLLMNPQMWIMAAIAGIMELWQRNSREMEAAEELAKKIYQHAQDAIKDTRTLLDANNAQIVDSNGNGADTAELDFKAIAHVQVKFDEIDKSEMQQAVDSWSEYISSHSANAGQMLNKALFNDDELLPLQEQYENLKTIIEQVVLAQYGLQDLDDVFENAVKATNGGWFDDDVMTDISDYNKAVKQFESTVSAAYQEYRKSIDMGIKAATKQNESFDKATAGLETYASKFKFLIENKDKFSEAFEVFKNQGNLFQIADRIEAVSMVGKKSLRLGEQRQEMMSELENFYVRLEAELQTKGVDLNNLTKQQQQALLLGYKDKLESIQGLSQGVMVELMKIFAKRFNIEFDIEDEKLRPKISEIERLLNDIINRKWVVTIDAATTIDGVIDEVRKKYKSAKEYFEKAEPILIKFGLSHEAGKGLTQEQIDAAVKKAPEHIQESLRKALEGYNEMTQVYNNAIDASTNLGFHLEDDKKKKSENGSKSYKDEYAKRWDERIRIMKEAYDWYDKWEKKVGEDDAFTKVTEKYGDIFKEWEKDKKMPLKFDAKDIVDYKKYVKEYTDAAKQQYELQKNDKSKNYGEQALRVLRYGTGVLTDMDWDEFNRRSDEFTSNVERNIDELSRKWQVFTSVINSTGNAGLAGRFSGISPEAAFKSTEADIKAIGVQAMTDKIIDFNAVETMSGKEIEEYVKGLGVVGEQIDGIVKALEDWKKAQQDVTKGDIENYAKFLGTLNDYASQMSQIWKEAREQIETINRIAGLTQNERQTSIDRVNLEAHYKEWQLSSAYKSLYNNAFTMGRESFYNAAKRQMDFNDQRYAAGNISYEEYAKTLKEIQNILKEFKSNGFLGIHGGVGAFLSGGSSGLAQFYRARAERRAEAGELESAKEDYERAQNLEDMDKAAKEVTKTFQDLSNVANMLGNMFDALGMGGAANAFSDAGSVLGGVASGAQSLSAFGPWGMAAGAAIGGITSLAQMHDAAIQREIEAIQREIDALEANTEAIKTARERTFGYDTGNYRRNIAAMYQSEVASGRYNGQYVDIMGNELTYTKASMKAMLDYYSSNTGGTGYMQEYKNLQAEREKYLQLYDKENDKKKKSQETLNQYKEKIAELDDQIINFSQDMAKSLWGIDVKGWADQISDALATAFENGENIMKAFEDTVKDVMQSVVHEILKVGIIEPMMSRLQKKLFGEVDKEGNYTGGVVSTEDMLNNPKAAAQTILATVADYFKPGGEGAQMALAAQEFLEGVNNLYTQLGYTNGIKSSDSANTLSASVQGIKEEQADILAGIVRSMWQDVAENRIQLATFFSETWNAYIEQVTASVTALNNIDNNVAHITYLLSENGALHEYIRSMSNHLDQLTFGNERLQVQ